MFTECFKATKSLLCFYFESVLETEILSFFLMLQMSLYRQSAIKCFLVLSSL